MASALFQTWLDLGPDCSAPLSRVQSFPQLRYMGSKHRLLPWICSLLRQIQFQTALDAFAGSGCVAYLLKALGKTTSANDFLRFSHQIVFATISNDRFQLSPDAVTHLLRPNVRTPRFIERTFGGVYFTPDDLRFLDTCWANLSDLTQPETRAMALAALFRACVKHQPRGVFTITRTRTNHDDGRHDLTTPLSQLFNESVQRYNTVIFSNGHQHTALNHDIFELPKSHDYDLVYLDPPYVPRADDNCYIKRYHFLEGLASYWQAPGTEILQDTRSRKIPKRYTPFSYRKTSIEAFDRLFRQFAESIIVLSYSSSGYPDLPILKNLLLKYKRRVHIEERPHRYHFGTHDKVAPDRAIVKEYLLIAQ